MDSLKILSRPLLAFGFLSSTCAFGVTSATLGGATFKGSEYHGVLRIVELAHEHNYFAPEETGWQSSIKLAHSSDPNSLGQSLALDQGVGQGIAFGVTGSRSQGMAEGESHKGFHQSSYAGRASMWTRQNTLRIGIEGSSQKIDRDSRDYQDTDGYRVLVASDAAGSTGTLRLTHLTTPTTISMANVSQTRATGRPVATSAGVELRQYLTPLRGAVHVGFDRYQDAEDIEATTDYGKIKANTQTLRYYQRLPLDFLLSSISRWHQETEVARSPDTLAINRSTFSEILGARWRWVHGSWTDECSEVGIFYGWFDRSDVQGDIVTSDIVRSMGMQIKVVI